MIVSVILLVVSFLLSLFLTGVVKQRFSQELLDIPNERSSHTQPTPRGGGLGFIMAFAVTSWLAKAVPDYFPQLINPDPTAIWLVLTPLVIVGILDDRQGVTAGVRYLVQLTSAGLAIACFGAFPQPWQTGLGTADGLIAILLTLITITALINFYNFMDGLDGLVAGVTAVQLGFLAFYLNQPIFWLLVAAILGFLWWNWSPAKIFMGDAGSTVLGASIVVALLNSDSHPIRTLSAVAVTLPLLSDAAYTLVCRLIHRENIFKAHRSHLYQRLHQAGWSHAQVAITYMIATSMIIFAVTSLGNLGSGLSLVGVAGAITAGELYLRWRPSPADL